MLATKLSAPTAAARAQSHDFLARLEQAERRDESVKLEVRDDRRSRRRSDPGPGRGRRRSEVELEALTVRNRVQCSYGKGV